MRRHSRMMILALLAAFAGCATNPENVSYLYGDRYNRANIHTFPTVITAVDGRSTMPRQVPVQVDPGPHVIELATAPTAGFRFADSRELKLNVEPCKRYYIVAERENRLQQDWRPVIEYVEHAGGSKCQ